MLRLFLRPAATHTQTYTYTTREPKRQSSTTEHPERTKPNKTKAQHNNETKSQQTTLHTANRTRLTGFSNKRHGHCICLCGTYLDASRFQPDPTGVCLSTRGVKHAVVGALGNLLPALAVHEGHLQLTLRVLRFQQQQKKGVPTYKGQRRGSRVGLYPVYFRQKTGSPNINVRGEDQS